MPHNPPGPTRAELAREVLLHRMRDYSEEFHCAGWLGGLEFLLWEVSEEGGQPWIQSRREISAECHTLAEIAGGWWVYEDETRPGEHGPVFIPMERWLQVLAEHDKNPPP